MNTHEKTDEWLARMERQQHNTERRCIERILTGAWGEEPRWRSLSDVRRLLVPTVYPFPLYAGSVPERLFDLVEAGEVDVDRTRSPWRYRRAVTG